MLLAREFLLLGGLGLIVAGLTTYAMTWVLVAVHLRDHHPEERRRVSGFMLGPRPFGWYLMRRYLALRDRMLDPVARMGFIGAWGMVFGVVFTALSQALGWI